MTGDLPRVLTIEEVADALRSTPDAVVKAFETGQLHGFQIGGEWRTTVQNLVQFLAMNQHHAVTGTAIPTHVEPQDPIFRDFSIEWLRTDEFSYRWPTRAGQQPSIENYTEAYEGLVSKKGRVRQNKKILIGLTTRKTSGMSDRRRAVIFHAEASPEGTWRLYPLVEFAGANDYATTRRLASVIRLPNRKFLKPSEPLPAEYRHCQTAVYSAVVNGPRARNCLAVVVRDDDLNGMARHALVRLKWNRTGIARRLKI